MKLTNLFQQHGADRTLGSWSFKKVVRCGLTPKFKDVPNLVNMLTYEMGGPKIECGVPYDFRDKEPTAVRATNSHQTRPL